MQEYFTNGDISKCDDNNRPDACDASAGNYN